MQASPFTPGEMARDVPGRGDQLAEISGVLSRVVFEQRLAGRAWVLTGPRGVGKTSLLRRVQRLAHEEMRLATVFVTAGNGSLVGAVVDELAQLGKPWGEGDVLTQWVDRVQVTAGVPGALALEVEGGRGKDVGLTRAVREVIARMAHLAVESDRRGLVILVDELQSADVASLRTLAYAWQELQDATPPVPAALIAAGLSHTPDVVTDAVTHAERFAYRPLRDLEPEAAREALTGPATALGVGWDMAALTAVVERAQGYPYFLQLYGDQVWHAAGQPDAGATLTAEHVRSAQRAVEVDLTALYRTRWSKATPAEQGLLQAMASLGSPEVARKDIAAAMGVETTALSVARRSLIDKGIIDAPRHGYLAFTVPGFGPFVNTLAEG